MKKVIKSIAKATTKATTKASQYARDIAEKELGIEKSAGGLGKAKLKSKSNIPSQRPDYVAKPKTNKVTAVKRYSKGR